MADEMESCEYIWNHELAMRRLLSLLRNGQSYCTDAECVELPDRQPDAVDLFHDDEEVFGHQFLWTFVIMLLAALLFLMRPSGNGRRAIARNAIDKPPHGDGHDNGPPPPAIH